MRSLEEGFQQRDRRGDLVGVTISGRMLDIGLDAENIILAWIPSLEAVGVARLDFVAS